MESKNVSGSKKKQNKRITRERQGGGVGVGGLGLE